VAIAFDNASSIADTILTTLTIPAFTISGENRIVIVGVASFSETALSTTTVVGNGTDSFTEITDIKYEPTGTEGHVSLHYFVAPAAGSYTIVVTCLGTAPDFLTAGAISLTGVDQSTPVGTPGTGTGTGTTATATATAADTDWLVDICAVISTSITVGADQSSRWEIDNFEDSACSAGMSTQLGSVAGDAMTWAPGASGKWVIATVPIKPSAGAAGRNPVAMGFVLE
jgi:hypothetical protein